MSNSNNPDIANRQSRVLKSGLNAAAGILLFFVILVGLYWLAGRSQQRLDLTRNKMYTLSQSTKDILAKLQDRVTVTVYATEKGTPPEWTEKRNELRELMGQYRRISNGKLQFTFIDPVPDSPAAKAAEEAGMNVVAMQEASTSDYRISKGYFGLVAEYRGKNEKVPFLSLDGPMEYQLTRVINKIAQVNIPKVGVMMPMGNPMMGQQSQYSLIQKQLTEEGFEVTELQPNSLRDISGLGMIMIIDPQELNEEALYRLDQFVMNGGKLFVAAPGVQLNSRMGMNNITANPPAINSILEEYGVRIDSNIVEDWQYAERQPQITQAGTLVQFRNPMLFVTPDINHDNSITKDMKNMAFIFTSSVSRSDKGTSGVVTSLVKSSNSTRVQQDGQFVLEPTELQPPSNTEKLGTRDLVMMVTGTLNSRYANNPPPALTKDDGTTEAVDTATILHKSKPEAQVIVAGSTLFLMDRILSQFTPNILLPINAAEIMARGDGIMELRGRQPILSQLRSFTPAESTWTQVLIIGGIPLLLIIFGLFKYAMLRRRKARYRRIYGGRA